MRLTVLAGSYIAFHKWCRDARIYRQDCEYISNIRQIRGRRFGIMIKVAGWTDNSAYTEEFWIACVECVDRFIYVGPEL